MQNLKRNRVGKFMSTKDKAYEQPPEEELEEIDLEDGKIAKQEKLLDIYGEKSVTVASEKSGGIFGLMMQRRGAKVSEGQARINNQRNPNYTGTSARTARRHRKNDTDTHKKALLETPKQVELISRFVGLPQHSEAPIAHAQWEEEQLVDEGFAEEERENALTLEQDILFGLEPDGDTSVPADDEEDCEEIILDADVADELLASLYAQQEGAEGGGNSEEEEGSDVGVNLDADEVLLDIDEDAENVVREGAETLAQAHLYHLRVSEVANKRLSAAKTAKGPHLSNERFEKLMHVRQLAVLLSKDPRIGIMRASMTVAQSHYVGRSTREFKGQWLARQIRAEYSFFSANGELRELEESLRGHHAKIPSLLDMNEGVLNEVVETYLTETDAKDRSPYGLRLAVNQYLEEHTFNGRDGKRVMSVSDVTVRVWLRKRGFKGKLHRKGVYYDGHERIDVTTYRDKEFLPRMAEFQRRSVKYDGEKMDQETPPDLKPGEKPVAFITHDECTYSGNDGKKRFWLKADEQVLLPKGKGVSEHCSELLCEKYGRVKLTAQLIQKHPKLPPEARIIIEPGKNKKSKWWSGKDTVTQLIERAIPIAEALYPGHVLVFAFDCSSGHTLFAPDALKTTNMNLNPGGAQKVLRDGWFCDENGVKHTQQMWTWYKDKDGKEVKVPKGIRQVLVERGLWRNGMKLECDKRTAAQKKNKALRPQCKEDACCASRCLSLQPDFLAQKPWIQEVVEERGHEVIFYPKYHCELNFIEYYWGESKRVLRLKVSYKIAALRLAVPAALDGVSVELIRKYARRSARFMDAYRRGLTGLAAAYAVKKYKGHRRIFNQVLVEIDAMP